MTKEFNPKDARALVERLLGYQLRTGYDVQTGVGTDAPSVVWADADYEVGDGTCGLHETQKPANEPAIPYVRFDALTSALDEIERLRDALEYIVEAAERPAYNSLEVGFRHTPLTPTEIAERTTETCRFIAQDARAALKGSDQ